MPLTINSNIASLRAGRRVAEASNDLGTVLERLSSGSRIVRASDDAAGLAVADGLRVDRKVFTQAVRNASDGQSLLSIVDGALDSLTNIVTRITELAEQSANGTLSSAQRGAIDAEAQELRDEFSRVSREAEFNGLSLLDGSLTDGVQLQLGYGTAAELEASLGGLVASGTFSSTPINFVADTGKVELADLDGDGNLDFIAGGDASGVVEIHFGDGAGGTSSSRQIAVGIDAESIAVQDFNNDGFMDIAAANEASDSISIILGNGDGTFQPVSTFASNISGPREIRAADVNNDGNLDLFTSSASSSNVEIYLGAGDGTFAYDSGVAAGVTDLRDFEVGDIDGDGNVDIVAGTTAGNVFYVYGDGTGLFSAPNGIVGSGSTAGVGIGDVNGDGILDIIGVDSSNDRANIFLSTDTRAYAGAVAINGVPESPQEAYFEDLTGDGVLDMVVIGQSDGEIGLFEGNGDGTFQSELTLTAGNTTDYAAFGDVNNDGLVDIVGSNLSDLTIFTSDGQEGGVSPILEFSLATQADALQAIAPLGRKLDSINQQRGVVGAFQSRLSSAFNVLQTTRENFIAAESQIRDADVASEAARLTRLQILQQASTAILAQANEQPAIALTLLA